MLFDTWVKSRLGKKTDFDGVYGAQCVDEIKDYAACVLEVKPEAVGDAWSYYENYNKYPYLYKNFDRIPNTATFVPKKGDIVVWSKRLNGNWGHVAVATGEGNVNSFYSYDQNWTGHNDPMTKIHHNYDYVLGVLRPKNQKNITGVQSSGGIDLSKYTDAQLAEMVKDGKFGNGDARKKALGNRYNAVQAIVSGVVKGEFKVKITANNLNVRKGAGVNYPIVRKGNGNLQIHKNEVYTIVQTVRNGNYTWGKLKSGAGWIALEYTTKL